MKKKILSYLFFFLLFNSDIYALSKKIISLKINDKIISSYEIKNKINTELVLRNLEINQENIDNFKNYSYRNL